MKACMCVWMRSGRNTVSWTIDKCEINDSKHNFWLKIVYISNYPLQITLYNTMVLNIYNIYTPCYLNKLPRYFNDYNNYGCTTRLLVWFGKQFWIKMTN